MSVDAQSHAAWDKFFQRYSSSVSSTTRTDSQVTDDQSRAPRKAKSSRELATQAQSQARIRRDASNPRTHSTSISAQAETDWEECMRRLRKTVLLEGVPGEEYSTPIPLGGGKGPARPLIWKLLLDVRTVDPALYLSLVAKGPSSMHDKIQNDAFRTLATDEEFKSRVHEETLIRVLDAFVWRYADRDAIKGGNTGGGEVSFSYVQGMNVLLAPFLYVMSSEMEAFFCFCKLLEYGCPTYVQPSLSGVHRGLELLDRCLQSADPVLFDHLKNKGLTAELYAFASVLTLSAGTPPLSQLIQLWDYILAFGPHLSVFCVVAQLLLVRDELLASPHPIKILRQFPDLHAKSIISIATTLIRDLDDALYDDLVQHVVA